MAITDVLPGVQIQIIVNGTALQEYEDQGSTEGVRTVKRYIEVVSGQRFSVLITLLPHFIFKGDCIRFRIYADGEWADGLVLRRKHSSLRSYRSEGREVSGGMVETFRFAALETMNDGRKPGEDEVAAAADLGIITIECAHQQMLRTLAKRKETRQASAIANEMVSEKALNGRLVSHRTEFGTLDKLAGGPSSKCETRDISNEPNPVAVFKFCYSTRAELKLARIIPRTPTPPPLEDRDVKQLSDQELIELQKRAKQFRDHKEKQIRIKREKRDKEAQQRKRARPRRGDIQLEIGDDGNVREQSTSGLAPRQVIKID